jgi:hypothetical protein
MSFPDPIRTVTVAVTVALLACCAVVHAATPEQQCQASKNKAAGAYAACRQGAEAKLATSGDGVKYDAALAKCSAKLTSAWQKADAKAAAAGVTCLDGPLTVGDFALAIDDHTDNVAAGLAGSGLGAAAPQGQRIKTGQTMCFDATGTAVACPAGGQDGGLQKGLSRSYTDNGDGTITDNRTGLTWEKLGDDGSIHDWDNTYSWATAISAKVATLNATSFAGHSDWRLPNVNELQSLIDYGTANPAVSSAFHNGCVPGCASTACSCTRSATYWPSTSVQTSPTLAWTVFFGSGLVGNGAKSTATFFARAVRGGS